MTSAERSDPDDAPAPRPRRGRKRRAAWHGLRVTWWVLLAPVLALGIAALLMIERDITAPSWVKDRVSARAEELLGGGSLEFGTILVRMGRDLHPRVTLQNSVLRDADGIVLARVAEVSGLLSPRGLAFERAALFQQVTLRGTQIALRRNRDGSVALAFDAGGRQVGAAPSLPALLDQIDTVFERPVLAALETIEIAGLVINYDDARSGRSWTVDGGSLILDLRDDRMVLTGAAALLSGGGVTEFALRYDSPRGSREADFSVTVTDAPTGDIATQSAALSWLAALEAPLSAELSTSADAAGTLGPLRADLRLGPGRVSAGSGTAPLVFDGAEARLIYDPASERIGFDHVALASDWGDLTATGQALPRDIVAGLPQTLLGQFTFADLALNPLDLFDAPVPINEATLDLRLTLDPFHLEIGQAVVTGEGFTAATWGEAMATPQGWQIAMDWEVPQITVEDLLAVWPVSVRPGTRLWLANNVAEGRLSDIAGGLRRSPETSPQVSMGFAFDGAEVRYLQTMPPIIGGRGYVSLVGSRFAVDLARGEVRAPQGGAIDMAGSTFTILDTTERPSTAEVELVYAGTITGVLSLLDQEPFRFLTRANRPVALADGLADGSASLRFPLRRLAAGELRYSAEAILRRVRSDQLVPNRTLAASAVTLLADNDGLALSGPVTLDGIPARGRWSRPLGPGVEPRSEVTATLELSPRALEVFNIGLPPGSVSGEGEADLVLDLRPDRPADFTLVSDLTGVGLALPAIGWAKPRAERGRLLVSGTLGNPASVDRLEISGGGLDAEGRIDLTPDGRLDAARFTSVRLGNWLNAPITVRGRGPGRPVGVTLAGGSLDLRRARFGRGQGDGGPVSLALDRLQITDGIALTGFSGEFSGAGGFSGQFSGQVNGGPLVQGTVVPRNGRSAVRLLSEDAGGVARAAGILRNAVGGTLDLTLLPAGGEGTFDGALAVRGLRVRDAPSMAALLDAISVVGLLQQLDGQGLAFDEVDATFRLDPSTIVVTQASAVGPGLGISLDGIYLLASKRMDFQGVISPLYLINSIGSVLTRKGEGLIGFNFTLSGTADAPAVSVNPLSAFTPGMFRDIFRRPPPEVAQ